MEERAILVRQEKDVVYIGDMPQLVVDLKTQNNYIVCEDKKIPYYREICLSRDLLEGKRKDVFDTAIRYYYEQACQVLANMSVAEEYRKLKMKE